jgi:serine/threonine protein phosphatase PrpC
MDSTVRHPTNEVLTSAHAVSQRGTRRLNNQDSYLIDECLNMFVVADGVGGYTGGEIASAVACEQLVDVFDASLLKLNAAITMDRHELITNAVKRCFQSADRRILCERSMQPLLADMATTALLAYIDTHSVLHGNSAGCLYVGNAGDSRALMIRLGNATQLSNDHTIAAGLQREGIISEDEAAYHPGRHSLYMNLGGNLYDGPEVCSCDVYENDRIVLITDGITAVLSNCQIADFVSNAPDSCTAAIRIVDEALEHGAGDDLTCVVVEVQR